MCFVCVCVLVCCGLLQMVGEALLYMLQCSLGQAYTAPLRQAWLNMYSIVVAAMSRGWAKNGEDKADWGSQREPLIRCCRITQRGCHGTLYISSVSGVAYRSRCMVWLHFTIGSTNRRVYFLCCGCFATRQCCCTSVRVWASSPQSGPVTIWAPHWEKATTVVSLCI